MSSHQRAARAVQTGAFTAEIIPLKIDGGEHAVDEGVRFDATIESITSVKLLRKGGVLSAANASQICDGAAGLLVAKDRALMVHGLKPRARIHHLTVTGGDPVIMLEEPIRATQLALKRSGMKIEYIDLFEINEAFASVPLAWLKGVEADPERMNVTGGAIALGHPLRATSAKLMTTLVHALRARGYRYGLQAMCEGGGLANVTIIEAL